MPSTPPTAVAKIHFLSTHRGETAYEVLTGSMAGERVKVRHMNADFYEQDWVNGSPWALTKSKYDRDIIGSVGIVNANGRPVSDDVLKAVDLEYEGSRKLYDGVCPTFCTGSWSEEAGWVRESIAVQ